jgi:RNA polymerase sigma factor (TIGR02999 family)
MPQAAVTTLLERARAGDADAFRQLVGQLYGELRTLARAQRRRLGAGDTVNTTAVVHEAYAKLERREDGAGPVFADRAHFLRVASRVMRDVIVDYARAQRAAKRGGPGGHLSLEDAGPLAADGVDPDEVLSLDAAVADLHRLDEGSARVAELRYFGGLSIEETAEALDLSTATVQRRWTVARAWLYRRLVDESPPGMLP